MEAFSNLVGKVLDQLARLACVLLFLLMLIICSDVFLRNVALFDSMRGFPAANDLSEAFLYLITLLSAPWLLRQGKHIRVDIVLRAIPPRWAWGCEWLVDLLGLMCSLTMMWYGIVATHDGITSGEMIIKALATPVWWWLCMLPVTFALLALEFIFRMHRLANGPRAPREEAVSAA
ncbi:MAG TPA: TRAP transporter small permease subunit [Burkholderiaceae bacterium]|nr:TRAP transporter small permease subunit [Burkholderiaceae bacterium]